MRGFPSGSAYSGHWGLACTFCDLFPIETLEALHFAGLFSCRFVRLKHPLKLPLLQKFLCLGSHFRILKQRCPRSVLPFCKFFLRFLLFFYASRPAVNRLFSSFLKRFLLLFKKSFAACIFQSASRIPGTMIARFNSRLRFFEPCRSTFRSTGLSTSPAVPHSLFSALRKEGGAVSRLLLLRKDPYFPRYSTMASPASIPLVSAQPTPQEPGKFAPSTPPTTSPAA